MCGDAIDVPWFVAPREPEPLPTDQIDWPGAAMSGFSPVSRARGPRELKTDRLSSRPGSLASPYFVLSSVALTAALTTPGCSWLFRA